MKTLSALWLDEAGFVVSSELVLIATILVIGMIVGLTNVRNAVVQELSDVAEAVGKLNQGYIFSSVTGHTSSTAGTSFFDAEDHCEGTGNVAQASYCVNVNTSMASASENALSPTPSGP